MGSHFDTTLSFSQFDGVFLRHTGQIHHADKRLKELGKQGRIIIKTSDTDVIVLCIYFDKQMTNTSELWVGSYGCSPLLECCTSQDNQRLPGLKQLSQFPDFQMNRQCNTDFQGTLMGYFD
jgi:hypothetical protein